MCGDAPSQVSVSTYLLMRLKELSVNHVFGIPGDYVLPFFDELLDGAHGMEHVLPCNELNGAYAADGYAKRKGFGAIAVTFGPGSLSCVNAVAGAYADDVPLLVIAGAPAVPVLERPTDRLLHHAIEGDFDANVRVFRAVTARSQRLLRPEAAAATIDAVLEECFRRKKPAYLELPYDLQTARVAAPARPLRLRAASSPEALRQAVGSAARLAAEARSRSVVLGHLALRHGQGGAALALARALGAAVATTFGCKDGRFESCEGAVGIYSGDLSRDVVLRAVHGSEPSHLVLAVGMTNNEFDTGVFTSRLAEHNLVVVGGDFVCANGTRYEGVCMADFLPALQDACGSLPAIAAPKPDGPLFHFDRDVPITPTDDELTIDRMMGMFAHFFRPGDIIYGDAGGMINTSQVRLPEGAVAFGNGNWGSIGAGFGGLVGGSFADLGGGRLIVVLGDGAFQMSAQDLSTLIKYHRNAVLFVLNNAGYAAERAIHPGKHRSYNDIQNWNYHLLGQAFGADPGSYHGVEVHTERELAEVMDNVGTVQGVHMVNIHLDPNDFASFNQAFSEKLRH